MQILWTIIMYTVEQLFNYESCYGHLKLYKGTYYTIERQRNGMIEYNFNFGFFLSVNSRCPLLDVCLSVFTSMP
jgi:hypothetical protein